MHKRDVHQHLSKEDHECLHHLEECHDACLHAIHHCLEKGGKHASPDHIRVLQDCVQMCHTAGDFILRRSPLHPEVCEACAKVCDACAKSCEQLGDKELADHCVRCGVSCHSAHTHRD